jgi:hypothetical protein
MSPSLQIESPNSGAARVMTLAAVAIALGLGCSSSDSAPPGSVTSDVVISPGTGIGQAQLGMRYADLVKIYGELKDPTVNARLVIGSYSDRGLDVILSSSEDLTISPDAVLLAVGAKGDGFGGDVRPGTSRAAIEGVYGVAPVKVDTIEYYPQGISVKYQGDTAAAVGVFPSYLHAPIPPEMEPAQSSQGGS